MSSDLIAEQINLVESFLSKAKTSTEDFTLAKGLLSCPGSLLSLSDFQVLLNNPLLTPDWLQVKFGGKHYDFSGDLLSKAVQQHQLKFIDKKRLDELIGQGASVVLEGIDLQCAHISELCSRLEQQYPCVLSNCVGFFSQSGNEAYGGHKDSDDVVVIQLSGQKKWRVYARQHRQFVGSFPMSEEQMAPLKAEIFLEPGDVLFVRSSTPHRVETVGKHSLHLAFDLWDKTPAIEEVIGAAVEQYKLAPADAYSGGERVSEVLANTIIAVGSSPTFRSATERRSKDAANFRQRCSRTSAIQAFEKIEHHKP